MTTANKSLSRQSQHLRKPLIIFPHLTRAKHRQNTRKNSRLLHVNRRMETLLYSHSRFINSLYRTNSNSNSDGRVKEALNQEK